MNQNVTISLGPLLVITTVILAVLKVTGKLAISWWLVTAPLWIGFAIVVGILALILLGCGLLLGGAWLIDKMSGR